MIENIDFFVWYFKISDYSLTHLILFYKFCRTKRVKERSRPGVERKLNVER